MKSEGWNAPDMVKKALLSPPSNVNVQRTRLKFVKKYLSLTVERLSFVA